MLDHSCSFHDIKRTKPYRPNMLTRHLLQKGRPKIKHNIIYNTDISGASFEHSQKSYLQHINHSKRKYNMLIDQNSDYSAEKEDMKELSCNHVFH